MIKTETYMSAPEQKTRVVELRCDDCQKVAHTPNDPPEYANWTSETYEVLRCSAKWDEGTSFPEGSSLTTYTYDICPECFQKRMAGLTPRIKETDW